MNFADHLNTLRATLADIPPDRWDDAMVAMCIADIATPIAECMSAHGLGWDQLSRLGSAGLHALLTDMPIRRADLHLHRQFIRNPQLRATRTELNDWSGFVPAVMYSDVVVCERKFADLIQRDGFVPRAEVFSDLRRVADVLQ